MVSLSFLDVSRMLGRHEMMLRILLLYVSCITVGLTCVPTNPSGTPTTTTQNPLTTTTTPITTTTPPLLGTTTTTATTTTTVATTTTTIFFPAGCCPPLMQTLTQTEFADGLMTFAYNNNTCRGSVVVTCSQTDPAFDLYAGIVANAQFFLDYGPNTVSFPGTCNGTDMTWYMGVPPLAIQTLECRLTNPPSAG